MYFFSKPVCLSLLVAVVSGCGVVDEYGERALQYNVQARRSQDAGLLLNIIRAQHRHPLEFTAVTSVTGNAQASGALGLTLPFGTEATRAYTANPAGSVSGSAQFQVSVLDTEEFIRGILRPIELPTLDYYFHQQFPREVLYYLLFDKIEVVDAQGRVREKYENYPDGQTPGSLAWESFERFADDLYHAGLITETIGDAVDVGPELSSGDLRNAEQLVKIEQAGFRLKPLDSSRSRFQLQKQARTVRLCFRNLDRLPHRLPSTATCGQASRDQSSAEAPPLTSAAVGRLSFSLPATLPKRAASTTDNAERSYVFYPRSTEGVIYYLGEVLRYQRDYPGKLVKVQGGRVEAPLFMVHTDTIPFALTRVSYFGRTYSISFAGQGRSDERTTQVLSFLSQLLSLNKSAKDLPATNVFTIVGR